MRTLALFQEMSDAAAEFVAAVKYPQPDRAQAVMEQVAARARLTHVLHEAAPLLPHHTAAKIRGLLATPATGDEQQEATR